jgi:hypothetical protein
MSKNPIAVQMYTLREESAKDFTDTLGRVAELSSIDLNFGDLVD